MSIYSTAFQVYEKLAAAKMNELVDSINSHTHDGTSGVEIRFDSLDGYISASQILPNTITGAMIAANSITSSHIINQTIVIDDIDINTGHANSLKVTSGGYAIYAP
jgi:hypothetical protein